VNIDALQRPKTSAIELMWATVWWRQVAYFATLVATACLLLYPILRSKIAFDPSFGALLWQIERTTSAFDIIVIPRRIIETIAKILQPLLTLALQTGISLLPAFTKPWFEKYLAAAWSVALLCVFVGILLSWGYLIDRRIQDRALAAWNRNWEQKRFKWRQQRTTLRTAASCFVAVLMVLSIQQVLSRYFDGDLDFLECSAAALDDCLQDRQAATAAGMHFQPIVSRIFVITASTLLGAVAAAALAYGTLNYRVAKQLNPEQRELPGLALWFSMRARRSKVLAWIRLWFTRVFVPALFALSVVGAALICFSRFSFAVMEGMDFICKYNKFDADSVKPGEKREFDFDIGVGCNEATIIIESGKSYQIEVVNDTFSVVGENGSEVEIEAFQSPAKATWMDKLITPILRDLTAPRYTPIVRVASDNFVIWNGDAMIQPNVSGRLFVFINEAVLGLPFVWDVLYKQNHGTWKVVVTNVEKND
jgi:hypothetical protein